MQRVLEPEVMDDPKAVEDYYTMDSSDVHHAFAERAIKLSPLSGVVLDAGTGPAEIPVLICQKHSHWQIIGTDLSKSMLEYGKRRIEKTDLSERITLVQEDVTHIPYPDEYFDMVISNTLVHHLPEPLLFFQELKRILKKNGGLLLRDLIRPVDEATMLVLVDELTEKYSFNEGQRKIYLDSLRASLTVDEVKELVKTAGLEGLHVYRSSQRHWTAERAWAEPV